jgi:hypothetical protein
MTRRIAALLPLLLATASQAAADPLADLLVGDGGAACFKRAYDSAHLAKNPEQRTRNVLLSLKAFPDGDGAVIRIRFGRSDGAVYIVGSCSFEPNANLDVQGKPLIEAFKGPSGLDCHAMTSADGMSAEEGGDFPVDLRDGTAINLYVAESLAGWRSFDRTAAAEWFEFGKDDAVFRIDRADAGACREMIDKLPWWE